MAPTSDSKFSLKAGIIRHGKCVWIGNDPVLHNKVVAAFHDSPVGGHSGFPATFRCIRRLFAWPKMNAHVQQYVRCCQVCQQAKPDRAASPGLLLPLPIPKKSWDLITMDFVDGLPQSGQYKCLLVVVDKRTWFAHFLPQAHPYTTSKVALLYMQQLYKLHGFPGAIVSDRDPVFTSHFWQELFKYACTELRMSTTNHPQTDAQTERVNQCLDNYLRCMAFAHPKKWHKWLSMAEWWYNTTFHTSLKMTPFQALYARPPPLIAELMLPPVEG